MDIAVMYHYVRPNNWGGIVPLEPEMFVEQLEILGKYYEIVSPADLSKPMKGKPRCVLTFDDGTKDQFTYAFNVLKEKGLPGYFTVMSGPLCEQRIPTFNLVHTVLSLYSDQEIWEELEERFPVMEVKEISNRHYFYETNELRRNNKYALNFYLEERLSREFLLEKALKKYASLDAFVEDYYINEEEWAIMRDAGMTLGVHGVHHLPYDGDPVGFYHNEIALCAAYMAEKLSVKAEWYTPAFGGGEKSQQMQDELRPILLENGYKGGFTTIEGVNRGLSDFWLHRLDCVNIPPLKNNKWFR